MLVARCAAVRQCRVKARMTLRITPWDRMRSLRHAISLWISERTGRVRRAAPEIPAGELTGLAPQAESRIAELRTRYAARFEDTQDATGALQAYEYLDFLDQAIEAWGVKPSQGLAMHDVGCASFSYASALVAFFQPDRLVGVEFEGYRRLRGGVNRAEKAMTNVNRLPAASFVIADYAEYLEEADLITAFFPFVSPKPVLGWRMPLVVLQPGVLFDRIFANLTPAGMLWMINHSDEEAATAESYARAAGFVTVHRHLCRLTVCDRPAAPVVSAWRRGP